MDFRGDLAGQDGDGEQGGEERRDGEQGRAAEVVQQEVEGRRAQPGRQLQRHRQDLQVSSFCFIFFEVIPSSELKRSTRLVGPHKLKRMLLRCRSLIIIRTPYS